MAMTADQYQSEEAAIKRRQAIAQMLMQQGQEPIQTNEVAGGYVVPVSPLNAIAKIAQQLSGAYIGRKTEDRATKLAQSRRQAGTEAMQAYLQNPDRKAAAISLISNEMAPAELKSAASNEFTALNKPNSNREGIGTGFDPGQEPGTMIPKTIVTPDGRRVSYSDYQLEIAGAKKQQPGYLEDEKFKLSLEDQALQRAAAARADAQLGLSYQSAQRADETAKRQEETAIRQERAAQEAKLQNIPPTHRMVYDANAAALKQIDDTIKAIEENPGHLGLKSGRGMSEKLDQILDPKGVDIRSKVTQVKALKKHELSGAAVTPFENKDYAHMYPNVNEIDEKAVIDKLKALRPMYGDINQQIEKNYSDPALYRNPIKPKLKQEKPVPKVEFLGFD